MLGMRFELTFLKIDYVYALAPRLPMSWPKSQAHFDLLMNFGQLLPTAVQEKYANCKLAHKINKVAK